jgi:hypothetical protein
VLGARRAGPRYEGRVRARAQDSVKNWTEGRGLSGKRVRSAKGEKGMAEAAQTAAEGRVKARTRDERTEKQGRGSRAE